MKLLVIASAILGQAMAVSPAKQRVAGLGKQIESHIIKCIVYKNSTGNYNHWVHEISEWLCQINDIKLKIVIRNPKKFREDQLEELIFGDFGDARSDARSALYEFKQTNQDKLDSRSKHAYPEFEIQESMITNLFSASDEMKHMFCNILSQNNLEDVQSFNTKCHQILDKYILE